MTKHLIKNQRCRNPNCNNLFERTAERKLYCSVKCKMETVKSKLPVRHERYYSESVPPGTVGAIHELVVCADLMGKGYHVFRAQSPSCPCDLIAMSDSKTYRVEVRTAIYDDKCRLSLDSNTLQKRTFDILAAVIHGGYVVYLDRDLEPLIIGDHNTEPFNMSWREIIELGIQAAAKIKESEYVSYDTNNHEPN